MACLGVEAAASLGFRERVSSLLPHSRRHPIPNNRRLNPISCSAANLTTAVLQRVSPKQQQQLEEELAGARLNSPVAVTREQLGIKVEALDECPSRDVQRWNEVLLGCNQVKDYAETRYLFQKMRDEDVAGDRISYIAALEAITSLGDLAQGRQVHQQVTKSGLESDLEVGKAVVRLYATLGSIQDTCETFDKIEDPDVEAWNILISSYCRLGNIYNVMQIIEQMESEGTKPDEQTYVTIMEQMKKLELDEAKKFEIWLRERLGEMLGDVLGRSVVNMFGRLSSVADARAAFDKITDKSCATYTAMMIRYIEDKKPKDAIKIFHALQEKYVEADPVAYAVVLYACASIPDIEEGRSVHHTAMEQSIQDDDLVRVGLIQMYARCGAVEEARLLFDSAEHLDVVAWSSMIGAYALKGDYREALKLSRRMQQDGVMPDDVSFANILIACCVSGLLEEAERVFMDMKTDYGVVHRKEHYGLMVDTVARKGDLQTSEELILSMPMKADEKVWEALFACCKVFGDASRMQRSAQIIMKLNPTLDPLGTGAHLAAARWEEARKVRELMRRRGIKKEPGKSMITINNVVHTFLANDRSHPHTKDIHAEVARIQGLISKEGYVPDTRSVLHDVPEETKQRLLWYHSERLAMAYGAISTPPNTPMRIIKNLRVCTDCHSASKLYAKVLQREIIVRDNRRFHHFAKDGTCSCGDYW